MRNFRVSTNFRKGIIASKCNITLQINLGSG